MEKGRKGMGSELQRNIMYASIRKKRALKNPSVCGEAPSAGEHCSTRPLKSPWNRWYHVGWVTERKSS